MKNPENVAPLIINWLKTQIERTGCKGFVVGVSGGIDSAVTSTLCARTGFPTIVLNMPIHQKPDQVTRSDEHIAWLKEHNSNVEGKLVDLTNTMDGLENALKGGIPEGHNFDLAVANTRSRLRMATLYSFANAMHYLVGGTGNKVEDYGIGFFTKYGDGGVDVSPIADLLKSEVYALGKHLGVPESIQNAVPTDGLWGDSRSDEDQIGASYDELEWALGYYDANGAKSEGLSDRQKVVLAIYMERHLSNKHKLELPPVCLLNEDGTSLA